ncbi:MAG: hypothetical protein HC779_07055, partial [Phyllobacteriaceae bacterium]|nr:hypothetical protein [Phyllobacteriaceae bacterium]
MTQTASSAAPDILRIATAQLNPTVGDIAGNLAKARAARADAARQGAKFKKKVSGKEVNPLKYAHLVEYGRRSGSRQEQEGARGQREVHSARPRKAVATAALLAARVGEEQ